MALGLALGLKEIALELIEGKSKFRELVLWVD